MSIFRLAARGRGAQALALALASTSALALALAGCDAGPPPQPHAQIQLTATDADTASVAPGKSTTFHVTMRNTGASTVSLISLQIQVDPKLAEVSVQCSAVAATCPTQPNNTFTTFVYPIELPAGGSMTFDVAATAGLTASGSVTNVATATILQGPDVAPVTSHGTIVEDRNGSYQAFSSDANQATIAIDFGALAATFASGGDSHPFTLDPSGVEFDFSTVSRFVTPTDLLVGGADFGHGPLPFVAGRQYATTVAELDGAAFNTVGLDLAAGGGATSRLMQMWIAGSTLSACVDATPRASMADCPAASQRLYALSVDGNTYTGIDVADDDTLTFAIAKSDTTRIYLAASASQFRIGLPMNTQALSWTDHWRGAGTDGDWHHASFGVNRAQDVLTLDSVTPTGAGTSLLIETAAVAGGPAGLLAGGLIPDSTPFHVIQGGPLLIVVGDAAGSANGTLAILVKD